MIYKGRKANIRKCYREFNHSTLKFSKGKNSLFFSLSRQPMRSYFYSVLAHGRPSKTMTERRKPVQALWSHPDSFRAKWRNGTWAAWSICPCWRGCNLLSDWGNYFTPDTHKLITLEQQPPLLTNILTTQAGWGSLIIDNFILETENFYENLH